MSHEYDPDIPELSREQQLVANLDTILLLGESATRIGAYVDIVEGEPEGSFQPYYELHRYRKDFFHHDIHRLDTQYTVQHVMPGTQTHRQRKEPPVNFRIANGHLFKIEPWHRQSFSPFFRTMNNYQLDYYIDLFGPEKFSLRKFDKREARCAAVNRFFIHAAKIDPTSGFSGLQIGHKDRES